MTLYERSRVKKEVRNEDLFNLLRVAVTAKEGMITSPPIGEVCEIIGKQTMIKRIDNFVKYADELSKAEGGKAKA